MPKETPTTQNNGLMFVEVQINGKKTFAMVDTSATNNFITRKEAKRLGLRVKTREGWLKICNSQAPLQDIAR